MAVRQADTDAVHSLGKAMRRRDFIITMIAGPASMVCSFAGRAQQRDQVRRIGILMLVGEADPQAHAELAALTKELQHLGWIAGQNVRIDYRWADGDVSRLAALAEQLFELRPDLLIAQGSAALAALRQTTRTLPIVFAVVTDPVGQGFVQSLARPGGNVTGFAMFEAGCGSVQSTNTDCTVWEIIFSVYRSSSAALCD